MFSAVPATTTFDAPVATESALQEEPAPVGEYISPLSAPTQRSREERDATGRAVASRLGLAWPPAKRIRRPGRPTADSVWFDALQNWTRDVALGHHDDDLRVQRERPRGWRPGDAMVPPSSHIELAGVSAAAASDPREKEEECTDVSYHRSSHVVRRWTTCTSYPKDTSSCVSARTVHGCTVSFGSGREGGTCWRDQRFLPKWLRCVASLLQWGQWRATRS